MTERSPTAAGRTCLRRLACPLVAVGVAACAPGTAQAFVYWSHPGVAGSSVVRSNLDGALRDPSFVTGAKSPAGVAVDAAHVYWTDGARNTIGRANLDGSHPDRSFITGADHPEGVAVDATHVYWSNGAGDTIGRANLDGSGPEQSFITDATNPDGVAVDAAHVYWSNGDAQIGRANLDGSEPDRGFIAGASSPHGVAVDGAHIYWTNIGSSSIGRANLDGSDPDQRFIAEAGSPEAVAVDAAHVYWTDFFADSIGRANLDGSSPVPRFITGADAPTGLALDAGTMPAPRFGRTVNLREVSGTVLVRLPGSSRFVALDAATQVPLGSSIDTRLGRVEVTAARDRRGGLQVGEFYRGTFRPRQVLGRWPLIELRLIGAFTGCRATSRPTLSAAAAAGSGRRSGSPRKVRQLWGDAKGRWRTTGKGSATTVRGTIWLVQDRCDGTLTRVRRGVVQVRDFARRRTVTVRAGTRYLAAYRR